MDKEERLKLMKIGGYISQHSRVACEVLETLKIECSKKNIMTMDDKYWPWHIMAAGPSIKVGLISLFCKGFRKTIEVQVLTKYGLADHRYKEMSFATPKGAANYIRRKYGN